MLSMVESMKTKEESGQGKLDTTAALIFDSVNAFAFALKELSAVQEVYIILF